MWSCSEKYMYYEICENGAVRDTILGLDVPHKINRHGYLTVYLPYAAHRCRRKNGTLVCTHTLHTVVADTFLAPPKLGQTIVDHIDGNRQNPHRRNLRWLSPAANCYNRKTVRGYVSTKYENKKIIEAPEGSVFPCTWVRDAEGKRSRVQGDAVSILTAPSICKAIRVNLINLMCANPLLTSKELIAFI